MKNDEENNQLIDQNNQETQSSNNQTAQPNNNNNINRNNNQPFNNNNNIRQPRNNQLNNMNSFNNNLNVLNNSNNDLPRKEDNKMVSNDNNNNNNQGINLNNNGIQQSNNIQQNSDNNNIQIQNNNENLNNNVGKNTQLNKRNNNSNISNINNASQNSNRVQNPNINKNKNAIKNQNNNKNNDKQENKTHNNNDNVNKNNKSNSNNSTSKAFKDFNALQSASNVMNNMDESGASLSEAVEEEAKQVVKKEVKRRVKEKAAAFFVKVILPILPYIILVILAIVVLLILIIVVVNVMDEDNAVPKMSYSYCTNVQAKWIEEVEVNGQIIQEEKTYDFNGDQFIAYEMFKSQFNVIEDKEALKSLAVVYRTNLYGNPDITDGFTCYVDVDEPVLEEELTDQYNNYLELVKETDNKVFSYDSNLLKVLPIDDYFSYTKTEKLNDKDVYRLYQDKLAYEKDWVDKNIPQEYIHKDSPERLSFSPFAAWALSANGEYDFHTLLYHFYTPDGYEAHIFKLVEIGYGEGEGGLGSGGCGDIPLSGTKFSREEFISKVQASNVKQILKTNAGKIYDISIKNNFNPEMVVIRAYLEDSPGGSTNNYWGIGCANQHSEACAKYSSFDEGVLGYINTMRNIASKYNASSLFGIQYKYSYIGDRWFNPGGSGAGGCYYYPHIKKYLSEARSAEVAPYCASGNTCSDSQCFPTTAEDQTAYTKWQMEKSLQAREQIFGISASECQEETVGQNGVTTEGDKVAKYAVETFDDYLYSQSLRFSVGYVDCSSMVVRAYQHFNIRIYNSGNSSDQIYKWCEDNQKVISGSNLAPGDLIFFNHGDYNNSKHYLGIGHVSMYIGGGKHFAAHSASKPPKDQVSVTNYLNNGDFFCRPLKK